MCSNCAWPAAVPLRVRPEHGGHLLQHRPAQGLHRWVTALVGFIRLCAGQTLRPASACEGSRSLSLSYTPSIPLVVVSAPVLCCAHSASISCRFRPCSRHFISSPCPRRVCPSCARHHAMCRDRERQHVLASGAVRRGHALRAARLQDKHLCTNTNTNQPASHGLFAFLSVRGFRGTVSVGACLIALAALTRHLILLRCVLCARACARGLRLRRSFRLWWTRSARRACAAISSPTRRL